jgi:ketosteroid isomerase-like protein
MSSKEEIFALLQAFQDGYTHRDVSRVDSFMELFTPDAEVIGTNGVKPGLDEWYTSRDAARELVEGDWEGWGDLRLDLDSASIKVRGDVGWIAASATVSQTIGEENYASFLEFIKEYIEKPDITAEQKLHYILRGGTNTVYELRRGEKFVWALRLTAVAIREESGSWKFAQVNFSFPTIYFPDVRIMDPD